MDDSLEQSPEQLEKNLSEYKEQLKEVGLIGEGKRFIRIKLNKILWVSWNAGRAIAAG